MKPRVLPPYARRRCSLLPAHIGAIAGGGGGDATDPFFANVVALMHCDGADAGTTFTDVIGHTFSGSGNAQLDTAQFKWGSASLLLDGTGDYISSADNVAWELGSGDHTLECWVRWNVLPASGTIDSFFTKFSGLDHSFFFGLFNNTGTLQLLFAASDDNDGVNETLLTGNWTPSTNTWYHVAASRISGNTEIYADGARKATGSDAITYFNNANPLIIGASNGGTTNFMNGWIDDIRITKGVGRYTGTTLTIPTAAFPDS